MELVIASAALHGTSPADGLTKQLLQRGGLSEETKELLGVGGFM